MAQSTLGTCCAVVGDTACAHSAATTASRSIHATGFMLWPERACDTHGCLALRAYAICRATLQAI